MSVSRLSQPYPFSLSIDKLALPVHLGVTEAERAEPQTVYADVRLLFPTIPNANHTDAAEFLCYDTLCQALLKVAQEKPVQLIEFLLGELYRCARAHVSAHVSAEVKLHLKLHKPLPQTLVGYQVDGATVEYTDLCGGLT